MKLTTKTADIYIDRLVGTGDQGRAAKALRRYRKHQTPESESVALRALSALDDNMKTDLRQATRL